MTRQFFSRLRSLWNWNRKESELDEEIQFHLSEEADERAAAGLTAAQARVAAAKDFGNATLIREATRDAWGWASAERLIQDVRWRASDDAARSWLFRGGGPDARARHWSDDRHPQRRGRPAPATAAVRRRRSAGRAVRDQPEARASTGTPPRFSISRPGRTRATRSRTPRPTGGTHSTSPATAHPSPSRACAPPHELLQVLGVSPAIGRTFDANEQQAERCRRAHQPRAVDAALRQRPAHPEQNHSPQRGQPRGHRRAPAGLRVPAVPGDGRASCPCPSVRAAVAATSALSLD